MNQCPDEAVLLDFAEGRLSAPSRADLVQHLEGCESCREVVDALTTGGGAASRLRTTTPLRKAGGRSEAPTKVQDPLIGSSVGEYRVEERIGEGGMGMVYRGVQPIIGKSVAIKIIRPELLESPSLLGRLVDEARAANAVGHRNIIDIFSFGTLPGGEQYFVMEYLIGTPLNHHLKRTGPLPAHDAVELLIELVSALAAAHAVGVVHRDLKPSNLFLVHEPDGKQLLKVLDFGIAKLATTDRPQTQPGAILGTPEYMSPEQVRGELAGPEADLYAVGVIAFELLAGRRPFKGNVGELMQQQVEVEAPSVSTLVRGVPPALEALVRRLLSKRASERGTTEQALVELKALARAVPVDDATEPSGAPVLADLPAPKRKTRVRWELAVVGVAIVVSAGLAWAIATRPGPEPLRPVVHVQQPPPPPPREPEPVPVPVVEAEPPTEPEPAVVRKPPKPVVDPKARRAELSAQLESLRKQSKDPTVAMLLNDAEKDLQKAQTLDELKKVERKLDAVRSGYLKKRDR